jgi:molybdate transport system regulatory protein
MATGALEADLMVQRDGSLRMGADRVRLLKAIREHGSISAAARILGLSYKTAWDAVNTMNNLFGQPLVAASPGGRSGGGAKVTPAGLQVIAAFAVVETELSRFLSALESRLSQPHSSSPSRILWSFLMRTSARNMFHCTVTEVTEGAVNAEVLMDVGNGQTLSAIITNRSARDLDLGPGKEVFALVKSSFVILTPEDGLAKTSARNRLCGTVSMREDGAVSSEIVLDLGGGKSIAAIVTKKSAETLALQPGDRACALIKASHIILAVE